MYYEERKIDGIWCWRGTPDGGWMVMNEAQLAIKMDETERRNEALLRLVATMGKLDNASEQLLREAGIDPDQRFAPSGGEK